MFLPRLDLTLDDIYSESVQQKLRRGQYISLEGVKGRYIGAHKRGTIWVDWNNSPPATFKLVCSRFEVIQANIERWDNESQ